MQRKDLPNAEQYTRRSRRHRVWQRIVSGLACVVVFVTTYALILPAITMEKATACGLGEHTHSESCYTQITQEQADVLSCSYASLGVHAHTEECWDENGALRCGTADYVVHSHDDACVDQEGTLVCQLPERGAHVHSDACYRTPETEPASEVHTHDDQCYTTQQGDLICQITETEGHAHGDSCYAQGEVPVCGQDGSEDHTHTPDCYETVLICALTVTEAHQHGSGCYEQTQVLTCQLPEETPAQPEEPELICAEPEAASHTHGESCFTAAESLTCQLPEGENHTHSALCYGTWELTCGIDEHTHALPCFSNPEADVETAADWEKTLPRELTEFYVDDVPAVAESQLGYTESENNYIVLEDGVTTKGYTRYGAWYGDPYGDWCAMFASFCLNYAEVENMPFEASCQKWIDKLSSEEYDLYREVGTVEPRPGDLIFFDLDEDEGADHVGIVTEWLPAQGEEPAKIKTIEGNVGNKVQEWEYDADDASILGYGILPPEPFRYRYTDENVQVLVKLPADTTVPENARLKVTPITSDAENFDSLNQKAEDAVDGTVMNILFYDLSFYTEDDEYIPMDDQAKVSMTFVEQVVDPASQVVVLHYDEEDSNPTVLEDVTVEEQAPESEAAILTLTPQPAESAETNTVVTFKTEGFSTFALVQVETGAYKAEIIDPNTGAADVVENKFDTITGYGNNDKQYVIVSADMKYALSSYAYVDNDGEDKLRGMEVLQSQGTAVGNSIYVNANKHLLWEFENTGSTGLIYIKNVATGEYLQLMRAGVALTTELTEGDPDNRQMIHTFEDDDSHKVGFAVNVDGDFYYLNRDAGGANYHTWTSGFESSQNNQFYLCEYKETVADLTGAVENPSANIPDPNKVYILAGVNYNDQYAGGENLGKPTILTGEAANDQQIETGANGAKTTLRHLTGEIATNATYQNNAVYFMSHTSQNPYLWIFEETGTEGVYNINLMGTNNYLHLDETGLYVAEGKQNITVETVTGLNNRVVQNNVIHLKATLTQDDDTAVTYYAFLNGNGYDQAPNDITAISSYKGRTEQENNPTTPGAEDASHFVMYEYATLVDGLEGKAYIISGVNNKTPTGGNTDEARITAAMLTPEVDAANTGLPADWNGNGLKSTTNDTLLTVVDGAVTNLKMDEDKKFSDYAWAFEDVGYGTYYIRSLVNGQYLNINQHSLTMSATPQVIEVIVANPSTQAMTVTENIICLRNLENEYVLLYDDRLGNAFTGQLSDPEDKLEANRGTELILTEYKATEDSSVLATDLGGKVYFAVAVNNANDAENNPPWMATTTGENAVGFLTGENRAVTIAENGTMTFAANADSNNNLGWYFQQTEQPGVYYLIAANNGSANEGKYLKISAGNNDKGTLTMVANMNDASRIEAVKADTSTIAADAKQRVTGNVICLRTTINGEYWYVNLDGNNTGRNFQSYKNDADAVKDGGNHFVLAEIKPVNDLVAKINTLLDNMILEDDGDWVFSEAGYTGSALPGNENANNNGRNGYGQQGVYGQSHDATFVDDYDQAQKYRREMQLLAREIRQDYAKLTEEDQRYIWRYEIVDSGEEDTDKKTVKDLKWLWDTVNVVQPNNPTGVKVNLFNYDGSVNETGLADVNGGDKNGFTFYHKVMYDEYTQIDTGRDNTRNNGTLGSDDSALHMYRMLVNGYPYVAGGRNAKGETNGTVTNDAFLVEGEPDEAKTGSLAYLFTPNNQYWEATMTDGGGLFQRDADGYYYYYANQNAAWYDPEANQFVLYDTVIRPMYNHGTQPNQVNDVYNFLPFNNPYDDLIFDEYNSIMSNQTGTNYGDKTNTKGEKYVGVAANPANTQRSGYLNERSDMWFGMTIEFDFLMSDDGQLAYYDENGNLTKTTDMIFDFYGDDDVWVYVDDRLVLDIGGVHEAQGGSINFHTGEVKYQDSQAQGGVVTTTIGNIFSDKPELLADVDGDGTKETFADYTPHTLKFFYMERGGNVSYCGLKFNMPILPVNYLMVNKELAESEEDDTLTEADILGDKYYTFRVVQADAKGNPLTDSNGKYMSFFDAYTPFNIYSGGNPTGNFGLVDEDGYFTIKAGDQAMFENVLQHRADNNVSNYVVMEVFFNEDTGQYEDIIYTVETLGETNNNVNGVHQNPNFDMNLDFIDQIFGEAEIGSVTQTTGVDAAKSQTVKFTNVLKPPLGQLAVTKELGSAVGTQYQNTEFTVKIELGDYAIVESAASTALARAAVREVVYSPINRGTPYVLTYTNANGQTVTENKTVESTDGTIKLKPGETATFTGVVAGTFYRVSEQLGADDKWTPTYEAKVENTIDSNRAHDYTAYVGGNVSNQFGYGDEVTVKITNTNYNVSVDIPLRKYVDYAAMTDNFTFLVQWIQEAYDINAANAAAGGYYTLPGTSITVTPAQAVNGNTGKVTIGFSDTDMQGLNRDPNTPGETYTAFYKISEQPGNGSYIYDPTYYIVQVTLHEPTTQNPNGTAVIEGIWKNGTESVTIPTPDNKDTDADETANPLEFRNHRTTSVVIDKEVVGGSTADEFEYSYTVKYPGDTIFKTGTFKLNHGEDYTITGVPIGAIVEVTEKLRDDYEEFYEVTAVYEAEYGKLTGNADGNAGVAHEDNASAGAYVGNIKGSTQTVTIPVYTNHSYTADDITYYFCYSQQDNRPFTVTDDDETSTYGFNSTGGWQKWTLATNEAVTGPALEANTNDLIIGGSGTRFAPNLDYLRIDFDRVAGNVAALNVLGDGSSIHFVNEPRTTVTIHKTVEGSDKSGKFTFNVQAWDANGNEISLPDADKSFTLENGESHTIFNLPIGSLVKVTENNTNANRTTMQVTTRLEAEDGVPTGAVAINSSEAASGGKWAGNISVTGTLTFNGIKIMSTGDGDDGPTLNFRYLQDDSRQFAVSVDGTPLTLADDLFVDCNNWSDWGYVKSENDTSNTMPPQTALVGTLAEGTHSIVVSGVNGYAPNLDYIDIVWDEVTAATVTQYVNGATTIEVVNETGYTLPDTGGTGVKSLYTMGGMLLMAAGALLLYSHTKRRKEDTASS